MTETSNGGHNRGRAHGQGRANAEGEDERRREKGKADGEKKAGVGVGRERRGKYLEQQLQQCVRLFVSQPDNALREPWVDKEGFLTRRLCPISIQSCPST